jgi:two-component system response regulator AdeR
MADPPIVLIVEDESALVEIYTYWLQDEYEVRTATSGEEALEVVDREVDIMVLDRIMPGIRGDEVVDVIQDRGYDCKIVMATAVEPDTNLITSGVDVNLTKPISRDELTATVSRVLERPDYEDLEGEFFDLLSERATLKSNDDDCDKVDSQIDKLQTELDERTETIDDSEFSSMMKN